MNGRKPWTAIAALVVVVVVVLRSTAPASAEAPVAPPTAEALIERVSTAWDAVRVMLTARITTARPGRDPTEAELIIRRARRGWTRIDFLAPDKDRGKVILQIDDETWLYLPRSGRAVEVPARRNPLAGGAMFEDLFPDTPRLDGATVETYEDGYVLVTRTAGSKTGENRIYFDRSTGLPVRREQFGSSGRLLKVVHIDQTRDWQGTPIPWTVRFVDHLRRGAESKIEVLEAAVLSEDDVRALFSLEGLEPP